MSDNARKTFFVFFRPGPTQTYKMIRDVAKTKPLISCAVTAQLICVFGFAYAKRRFFHDAGQIKQECNTSEFSCRLTIVHNSAFFLLQKDILQSLQSRNLKVDTDSLAKMQQFYDDFVGF